MRRQKRSKEVAHVSLIYSRVIEIPKLKPADEFRWRRRWWILVERKRNYVYHNAPGDDVVGSLVPDGSLSQHQRFAQGMLTWHAQYHGIMINICLQNLNWVGAWPWETFGHWSGPYLGCNDAILEAKHSFFSSFEVCKIYRNVHLSKRKISPNEMCISPNEKEIPLQQGDPPVSMTDGVRADLRRKRQKCVIGSSVFGRSNSSSVDSSSSPSPPLVASTASCLRLLSYGGFNVILKNPEQSENDWTWCQYLLEKIVEDDFTNSSIKTSLTMSKEDYANVG